MNTTKIKDVCVVVSGTTPKSTEKRYWNGTHVWITPAELTEDSFIVSDSERHITDEAVKATGLKPFPKGTVLLSSRAPIGKVAIAGCDMYCNQGFKNLICSDSIYNLYLYYFLKSKTEYLNSLGRGATFKEISKGIVEDITIPFPAYDEQIHIAKQLQKITELIALKKRQYRYLDDIIRSRFLERFGEPGVNDKEFPCYPVGQIAESVTYGTSAPASNSGQYEYLRMNNLTDNGQLDLSDLKRIDMSDEQAEKYMVKKGDILFNRTNSIDLVGKTALFNLNTPMIIAGYLIRIRLSDKVNPVYFTAYMNMPYMKEKLRNMAKGAVNQANINSKELKSIQILIPPLSLQNEYCNFVLSIDKSKYRGTISLHLLEDVSHML